jgi:hypothetical protein
MSGPRRAALFFVCLLAGSALVASAEILGQLAKKDPHESAIVKKTLPNQAAKDMEEKEPVEVRSRVDTGKDSGARFTMGPKSHPQGAVIMGPESRFEFREGLFDSTTGLLTKLDFEINWGRFRFAFAPPLKGSRTRLAHPGEVVINTSKNPTQPIHLYGTDVNVSVGHDGATTLYVAEGFAVVGEPGHEVRVEAGYWTTFGPGLPPRPPARAGSEPADRTLWSRIPEIPGPADLDIRSSRLDLPKSRRP